MRRLTLYPAIDLKGGQCVRLRQGEMADATVYGDDPGAQAAAWQAAGFGWVHVVDLDGAFAGHPVNRDAVLAILAAVQIPVQLGGGIRDRAAIDRWLEAGVSRVILGSVAARDPELVRVACAENPGRIVVGIDARAGLVATQGWAETGTMTTLELAARYQDAGAAAIIYTDIGRDGMLGGVDLDGTAALSRATRIPVIASGGVGSLDDLAALRALDAPNIEGVVVGRALYDGRITAVAALRVVAC